MIHTTSIDKIRRLRKRKKIVQGGSSSGKTFAILIILIDYCIRVPNTEVSVVSESMPHLRRGALRDFLKIMKETGRYNDNFYNKSNLIYTFSNDSYIEFFSADQPDKLRGARRDILYINECNNVDYESYQQLSMRTRGDIYLDYNPSNRFWVHDEVMNNIDADFIILKYTDNEALEPSIIAEFDAARKKALTSDYWANWVKVYVEGELGSLQGAVFQNFRQIDRIPSDARLIGVGLDFGYSVDPSAAVALYYQDGQYIVDELFYQKELTNSDLSKLLISFDKSADVYCDSAEPKSVAELKRYGVKAHSVKKGKDSILYSIDLIQTYDFLVTSSSKNLLKELENYTWKIDRLGQSTNQPIDRFNHAIDAMRYIFMSKTGKRNENRTPFRISN